jgi:hypothetical protein
VALVEILAGEWQKIGEKTQKDLGYAKISVTVM